MNAQNQTTTGVDPTGAWMYRAAGISAIVLAVAYLVATPLYALVGDQPASGVEAQLAYFADHAAAWGAIVLLVGVTDLLWIPTFIGIYLSLKHMNRGMALLALSFAGFLFVILDLAVTWTAYTTLIIAGADYGAATTVAERADLVAGAAYASAMLGGNPVAGLYAICIPSIGMLFAGLLMLKGVYGRITAFLALASALAGILFMGSYVVDALAVLRYIGALLTTFFFLLAGIRLLRLGWRGSVAPPGSLP